MNEQWTASHRPVQPAEVAAAFATCRAVRRVVVTVLHEVAAEDPERDALEALGDALNDAAQEQMLASIAGAGGVPPAPTHGG